MFPYFPLISLNVRLAVILFFRNYKAVASRDDFIFFGLKCSAIIFFISACDKTIPFCIILPCWIVPAVPVVC